MRYSPNNQGRSWSLRPNLHDAVDELLQDEGLTFTFHPNDDSGCLEEYDTNIMGAFECSNRRCASRRWTSKKIAITIRMYQRKRYNARVYHQRCRSCNWLSSPSLDSSYAERISYRLKKWSAIPVTPPPYLERSGPPHRRDLCEGCEAGHCTAGRDDYD